MSKFAAALMGAIFFLTGCPPEKPSMQDSRELEIDESAMSVDESEIVVARINGEEITLEEFNRRIEGLAPFARVRFQSPERRKDFLNSVAQFEVMADVAEVRGYGDRSEVRHAMKETMMKLLLADALREEGVLREIAEEDLRAHFEANREEFQAGEKRRLVHLVVEEEARAQELAARWEERYAGEEDRGSYFQRFAFRHSEDRSTGDRFGDLGRFEEGDEEEWAALAFEAEPGELIGPREVSQGWELLMVVEVTPALEPDFEEVESQVSALLREERRERARREKIAALRNQANVEVFAERARDLEAPKQEAPLRLEELPREPVQERR